MLFAWTTLERVCTIRLYPLSSLPDPGGSPNFRTKHLSERLNVLVLHGIRDLANERRTSVRHMFALQRYSPNHRFVYHYVEDPHRSRCVPFLLE